MLKKTVLLALLLGSNAFAIEPPEGARLVGSEPTVKLAWEGASKTYYLQILAAGQKIFEGDVSGSSYQLGLQPNVYYTWSITPAGGLGQSEAHHFQYSPQLNYDFNGGNGSPGRTAPQGDGTDGGPGQPGENVQVYLAPQGDCTSVRIEGNSRRATFLLLPKSAPLQISARGGDGGAGGAGITGADSHFDPDNPRLFVQGTPGGSGGKGGDGGAGGQVFIHNTLSPGSPFLLKINIEGGKGGRPGAGGKGGLATDPRYVTRSNQPAVSANAPSAQQPSGSPGAAGKPGPQGSISDVGTHR